MPVEIVKNTIAMPDRAKSIRDAVIEGIGSRPANEAWKVRIFEPSDRVDYIVIIEGANNFKWRRDFFGVEQTPEFIREEVRSALSRPLPPDYIPIIEKLLQKSEEGRVQWSKGHQSDQFVCQFGTSSGTAYILEIAKIEDEFVFRMKDENANEVLTVTAQEDIVFGPLDRHEMFNRLRDLFELAGRKALAVDEKLANVAELLDAI